MTAIVTATAIASIVCPLEMAHIALGEVGGPGIWGDRAWELQAMVVWVARNQVACSPADYDPRSQFYAWEEDITQGDIDRAAMVLAAPQEADLTRGALHVISEADRIKLGFPKGDIVECGVAPFCLHFYYHWGINREETRRARLITERRVPCPPARRQSTRVLGEYSDGCIH